MENESLITHKVDIRLRKYGNDHHPRLIIEDFGNKFVAVEMTHEKRKGHRRPNYKLQINPTGEERQSYVRTRAEIMKKNQMSEVISVGIVTEKDFNYLKKIAKKAIDKYEQKL